MSFNCSKCKPYCGAVCCGSFPWDYTHLQMLEDKAVVSYTLVRDKSFGDDVFPKTANGMCPFLNADLSCNVYADRPSICKSFGSGCGPDGKPHWAMKCPMQTPDGKITNELREKKKIIDAYVATLLPNSS